MYARSDVKKPKADPQATVRRILGNLRVVDDPLTFKCHVCRDQGFVELEPGAKAVVQSGATITVAGDGRGVVERCRGMNGSSCRYRLWCREEAVKAKQLQNQGSGEGAAL